MKPIGVKAGVTLRRKSDMALGHKRRRPADSAGQKKIPEIKLEG